MQALFYTGLLQDDFTQPYLVGVFFPFPGHLPFVVAAVPLHQCGCYNRLLHWTKMLVFCKQKGFFPCLYSKWPPGALEGGNA
jgi:hypothetical protein